MNDFLKFKKVRFYRELRTLYKTDATLDFLFPYRYNTPYNLKQYNTII